MDPNAALQSILSGHMIADHAEALRDWLRNGGFEPSIALPVDCHPAFAALPRFPAMVRADARGVFAIVDPERECVSIAWQDVLALAASEF